MSTSTIISTKEIEQAAHTLKTVVTHTPLVRNTLLSDEYEADIWFKREDLQVVRSYKIRGAYNKIESLSSTQLVNGVVCASAGNHAQGVALACYLKKIPGTIFMPETTPQQKVEQVKMFGKEFIDIVLHGDTFDDSYARAAVFCNEKKAVFIPPFDDPKIIAGQGTVGKEILEDMQSTIDYLLVPVGGGGLSAGVGSYFKAHSPKTKIVGVEAAGAPAMKISLEKNEPVTLDEIDHFVDGAAIKRVGDLTFEICKEVLEEVVTVPEGKICGTILKMYNEQAIVVEPAGALSISVLDELRDQIKGKTVVCIVSGSNNDIMRTAEIKERHQRYLGLKHYFIVDFPQRAGALREFLNDVLGPEDDITYFEYSKKTNQELGPALIGIELKRKEDLENIIARLNNKNFHFEYVNEKPRLFKFLN